MRPASDPTAAPGPQESLLAPARAGRLLSAAAVAVLVLAAQGATAAAPERVVLQLRWHPGAQFAGYHVAQWRGLYAREGLEVELRSGFLADGTRVEAVEEVQAGRAQFGVGAADILMAPVEDGPLTVLASIFQESATVLLARAETSLRSPADLPGLRVARTVNGLVDVEIQAMLLSEGIDPRTVTPHSSRPGIASLVDGTVDVIPAYTLGASTKARLEGIELQSVRPREFGIRFYGDSLFATEALVRDRPELVERFRRASLEGWRLALANPEETSRLLLARLPPSQTAQPELVREQLRRVIELSQFPAVAPGHVNPARWLWMNEQLAALGLAADPDPDPARLVHDPVALAERASERRAAIAATVAAALLAGLLLTGLWTISLRRRVEQATRSLAEHRRHLEEALSELDRHVANTPLAAIEWQPRRTADGLRMAIRRWTGRAPVLFGWPAEALEGREVDSTLLLEPGQEVLGPLSPDAACSVGRGRAMVELRTRSREGIVRDCRWYHSVICGGAECTVLSLVEDITEQVAAERQVRALALHDTLTGLPNRRLLAERLEQAMDEARASGRLVALALCDLDGFKHVNDTMGHDAGDGLLRELALRMNGAAAPALVVARTGGDEFAVLQTGLQQEEEALPAIRALLDELARPVALEAGEARVGASFGISFFPADAGNVDELFRHADLALYRAKASGRGRCSVYEPWMEEQARERAALERDLLRALAQDELVLRYQPVIDLRSRLPVGIEALLRWQHRERGLLLPHGFLPAAEALGLGPAIASHVLWTACRDAASADLAGSGLRLSVNIATGPLHEPHLESALRRALEESGLKPELLELEIGEAQSPSARTLLDLAERLGLGAALDGLGAGTATFACAGHPSLRRLKIGRVVTASLPESRAGRAMLHAALELGRGLGRPVVAVGVETEEQLALLAREGCEEVQGRLLAAPVPASELPSLLRALAVPREQREAVPAE